MFKIPRSLALGKKQYNNIWRVFSVRSKNRLNWIFAFWHRRTQWNNKTKICPQKQTNTQTLLCLKPSTAKSAGPEDHGVEITLKRWSLYVEMHCATYIAPRSSKYWNTAETNASERAIIQGTYPLPKKTHEHTNTNSKRKKPSKRNEEILCPNWLTMINHD